MLTYILTAQDKKFHEILIMYVKSHVFVLVSLTQLVCIC